jgi:hypothetical protein
MPALDPGIHHSSQNSSNGWIAGSSPAMTSGVFPLEPINWPASTRRRIGNIKIGDERISRFDETGLVGGV